MARHDRSPPSPSVFWPGLATNSGRQRHAHNFTSSQKKAPKKGTKQASLEYDDGGKRHSLSMSTS